MDCPYNSDNDEDEKKHKKDKKEKKEKKEKRMTFQKKKKGGGYVVTSDSDGSSDSDSSSDDDKKSIKRALASIAINDKLSFIVITHIIFYLGRLCHEACRWSVEDGGLIVDVDAC